MTNLMMLTCTYYYILLCQLSHNIKLIINMIILCKEVCNLINIIMHASKKCNSRMLVERNSRREGQDNIFMHNFIRFIFYIYLLYSHKSRISTINLREIGHPILSVNTDTHTCRPYFGKTFKIVKDKVNQLLCKTNIIKIIITNKL